MKCTHDETKAERKPNTKRKGNNKKKQKKNKTQNKKIINQKAKRPRRSHSQKQKLPTRAQNKAKGSRQKETEGHHCNHHQATTTVELPGGGCTGEEGKSWQTGISLPRGAVGLPPSPRGRVLAPQPQRVCLSPVTLLGSHRASCFVVPLKQLLCPLFSLFSL